MSIADIYCQNIIGTLLQDYNLLSNNIIKCNDYLNKAIGSINSIISGGFSLTDLTDLTIKFDELEVNIDLCISDIGSIDISVMSCLFPIPPYVGFSSLPSLPSLSDIYRTSSYGKLVNPFIKSFNSQMDDFMSTSLTLPELSVSKNLFNLSNHVNVDLYDSVIEKINCITENLCTSTSPLPNFSSIGSKLNLVGLDSNLSINYSAISMPSEMTTFFSSVVDKQNSIKLKLETLYTTYL